MPKIAMPNPLGEEVERYWTIPQVADRLGVSEAAVKKWILKGKLERDKFGSLTRISESALQRFRQNSNEASRAA